MIRSDYILLFNNLRINRYEKIDDDCCNGYFCYDSQCTEH